MSTTARIRQCLRALRVPLRLAVIVAFLPMAAEPAVAEDATESIRIRVAWGGGNAKRWQARASLSSGELQNLELLGRARDTPGSIWIAKGEVRVAQPRPRAFDGFDITAEAPLSAVLRLDFHADGQPLTTVETTLLDLMTTQLRKQLGADGNRLLVHRAKDDALRVTIEGESLIYAPGEELEFSVSPAIANMSPGASLDLAVDLREGRSGESVWSGVERISLPARGALNVPVNLPLPDAEGVYTLRIIARNPPGNRVGFWGAAGKQQLASREFQIVVFDESSDAGYKSARWQSVLEIDPANPAWWNRLPSWTRIDRWADSGPMGSEPFRTSTHQGRTLAEISAGSAESPAWRGYPLPSATPGLPHVVEIELPADLPQQLAVRIYEPNSEGKLVPVGVGSGVTTSQTLSDSEVATTNHRHLFWPNTTSPVLVVQNADRDTSLKYGKIRLRVVRSEGVAPRFDANQRDAMAYLTWDGLVQLCATEQPAQPGRPAVDDWMKFYTIAHRLADYVELGGYNGAVINVFAEGSAACQCGSYPVTPTFNSCRVASGMSDVPKVDPLEILFRVFNRRGLKLSPTLRFNATLPNVDAQLRAGLLARRPLPDSLPVWTDRLGRPKFTVDVAHSDGPPHYDISNPAVASEVQQVVANVVRRYNSHPAFAGIGLELSDDSFLPLPPAEFGCNRHRLTQLAVATDSTPAQLEEWLSDPAKLLADPELRNRWLELRADHLESMLQDTANLLRQSRPEARLLLLTSDLLLGQDFDSVVRPKSGKGRTLDELFLERGLNVHHLANEASITLLQTHHEMPSLALTDAAKFLQLNQLKHARGDQHPFAAHLRRHEKRLLTPRLSDGTAADAMSPVLFQHSALAGEGGLVRAIAQHAQGPFIVGGTYGPGPAAVSGLDLMRKTRRVPTPDTDENKPQELVQQPVLARMTHAAGRSVCVLHNPSPWPATATVTLDVGTQTTGRQLAAQHEDDQVTGTYAAGQHAWTVKLEPYSIEVLELSNDEVDLVGLRLQLEADAKAELASRLEQLKGRDLKPAKLPRFTGPVNPSFEDIQGDGSLTGWLPAVDGLSADEGIDDDHALRLFSTGEGASVASQPFRVPATAQVALTVYVRAVDVEKSPKLRLVIEEVDTFAPPRFIVLDADRLSADREQRNWNGYQFGVEDLPFDSTAKMRVRFDLVGQGEVWIDDVQLHDLVYPLDLYETESQQQVLAFVQHLEQLGAAIDQQRYTDCLALLESYPSRFILSYLPEIEPEPSLADEPGVTEPPVPDEKKSPRMTDRVRDFFRF